MLFFKKYLIPSKKEHPILFKLVTSSYSCLTLEKICAFTLPYTLKMGIDALSNGESPYMALGIFCVGSASLIGGTFFEGKRIILNSSITRLVFLETSSKVFGSMLKMDWAKTLDGTRTQIFSTSKAKKALERNFSLISMRMIPISVEFALVSGVLGAFYGPEYLAIFAATIFGYISYTKKTAIERKKHIVNQHQYDKIGDFLINESMQNYFVVKSNETYRFETNKYTSALFSYVNSFKASQAYLSKLNLGQKIITTSGLTAALSLAVFGVSKGTMTIGDLVFLRVLLNMSYRPLFNMGNMYIMFLEAQVEMQDIFALLNQKNQVSELPGAKELEFQKGEIEFRNVNYKFEKVKLFDNFNLKINPGSLLVVTGESGIGKSTLMNLLVRFFDPEEGDILIDGQNIKNVTFKSLRKNISYCPQSAMIFNDNVLNNLIYANLEKYYDIEKTEGMYNFKFKNERVVPKEVEQICDELGLHDKISSMEDGYFGNVGDKGQKFSGGERQRLSIARTMLKEAKILLFDEPTNGLDAYNEKKFIDLISRKKEEGYTVIIVTHKLNLSLVSDQILLISKGGDNEIGTHDELYDDGSGKYKQLYDTYLETAKMEKQEIILE